MRKKETTSRTLLVFVLLAFVGSIAGQAQTVNHRQYREMRKQYSAALEALGNAESHLALEEFEQAAAELKKYREFRAGLDGNTLPAIIKRSLKSWDGRVKTICDRLEDAGVKIERPKPPAVQRRPAQPTKGPATDAKPIKTVEHDTKFGAIKIETLPPEEGNPRYRIWTKRYEIYSELTDEQVPPLEIGKVIEAARDYYEAFFEYEIPADEPRWKVEIYANEAHYREAGRRDSFGASGGGRYMWHTEIVYLYWQPAGTQFTRGLIIHECEHQMHHKSGRDPRTGPEKVGIGSGRFGFIDEGLATFFEGHHWDRETDTLRIGVPSSQSRAHEALRRASGRKATFGDLIASPRDYAEVWGLMHYLIHNRPEEARAILSSPDDPAKVWESVFGSLDVSEDFHRDYLAWLKKMGEGPANVCFTSWDEQGGAERSDVERTVTPPRETQPVDSTSEDGPPSENAWNQWRGPHRNGVVLNSPPLIDALPDGGLAPAWTWTPSDPALQKGWATPLIVGQRVYVLAHDGAESGMPATTESVVCLDLENGAVIWKCSTPSVETEFPISNTPVIDGDRLYYLGGASQVRCVDCRMGEKLWSQQLPRSADHEKLEERPRGGTFEKMNSQSSLLVVGDMLIVSAAGDGVAGLTTSTGEVVWSTETQEEPRGRYWLYATWKFSSPVVWKSEGGKQYVLTSEAEGLTCRDPASGHHVWHLPHRCGAYATPVVVGNQLVMVSEEGLHGYTLSLQSPEQRWHVESVHSWDRGDYGMPSPLIVNGHVYTLDQRGILTCVNVESGDVQWSERIPFGKTWSCPIAVDGKVFWCFGKAGLYCLIPSPERFHALFAAKRDKAHLMMSVEPKKRGKGDGFNGVSSPSIWQGYLILRDQGGVLLCYDLRRSSHDQP